MQVRNEYSDIGVEAFYKKHSMDYRNPHEQKIYTILSNFLNENCFEKDLKILDLCAGSGEITRILKDNNFENIIGSDPFTNNLYRKSTNKECLNLSFKDLAQGKLKESFDLVICSFAMHLAEKSLLPNILYNLSIKSKRMIILTPHKKPDINMFFQLKEEIYKDKIRLRYYEAV